MIRVPSTSLDELEDVFMAFENEVEGALTLVMGRVMRDGAVDRPPEKMSVDDLNVITPIWAKEVDRLLAVVKERYVGAANDQRARILDALNVNDLASSPVGKREPSSLVAAAPSSMDEFSGENASAVSYLQDARNRLVGVGDDLWSTARGELVTAMQQGESIPQMTKRVRDSTSLAAPRARTIARTEVVGASNAGSLAFMQQTGVASKKEWLATEDSRTRETHRAADGQKVAIDAKFSVGGALLDHPGDSYGPAREVVNCRCTMIYEVDDNALGQADAASEDQSDDTGLLPGVTPDVTGPSAGPTYAAAVHSDLDAWRDTEMGPLPSRLMDTHDPTLQAMWKRQGFDGLPHVVESAEIDAMVRQGAMPMYRGLHGESAADYAEQFRSGAEPFAGLGAHGNGTYFGTKKSYAEQYASESDVGRVMTAVLRPDAKIIDKEQLIAEQGRLFATGDANLIMGLTDPGRLATALGYDAIRVPRGPDFYYVVLNRSAVIISREDQIVGP